MYLRETRRTNRDGSVVAYLQLAHNERHPQTGSPIAKVIHNFGRAEKVDRAALARLVNSISRFLTPEQAASAACSGVRNREIEFTSRASAARSTFSARPKLWITFEIGLQVGHHRTIAVRPARLPQVHAHNSSAQDRSCRATRPSSCAYTFRLSRTPLKPVTCTNAIDQARV